MEQIGENVPSSEPLVGLPENPANVVQVRK